MASIHVFCERSELQEWLVELARSKELRIVDFEDVDNNDPHYVFSSDQFQLRDDSFTIFLVPHFESPERLHSRDDIKPREWGWVHVRAGGVRQTNSKSVLLYSEIHGERCDRAQCNPHRWVQWLKKTIKGQVHTGVVGRNTVYGGESTYDDIWYTDKAKGLFNSGVMWKQFLDANSIFEPLK